MTLTVERVKHSWNNQSTYLRDNEGHVKAIIANNLKQPKYGTKNYIVNGKICSLDWSKVELRKRN
jgi:hypothetical protein|nr:MAG TPA: hypothetical protein [Caudoviricetes sp.]